MYYFANWQWRRQYSHFNVAVVNHIQNDKHNLPALVFKCVFKLWWLLVLVEFPRSMPPTFSTPPCLPRFPPSSLLYSIAQREERLGWWRGLFNIKRQCQSSSSDSTHMPADTNWHSILAHPHTKLMCMETNMEKTQAASDPWPIYKLLAWKNTSPFWITLNGCGARVGTMYSLNTLGLVELKNAAMALTSSRWRSQVATGTGLSII